MRRCIPFPGPLAVLAALLLIASGCASLPDVHTELYDEAPRESKPKDFGIELLPNVPIELPHKVIGLLTIEVSDKRTPADILEKMKQKAREMGAEALVNYTIVVTLKKGGIPEEKVLYTAEAVVFEGASP